MDTLFKKESYRRLNGYSHSLREDYLLVQCGLTDSEFLLYRLIKESIADWDTRHDRYGMFTLEYDKIAFLLNWSISKVRKTFKSLSDYGFFELHDKQRKLYKLVSFIKLSEYKNQLKKQVQVFETTEEILTNISKQNNKGKKLLEKFQQMKEFFPELKKEGRDSKVRKPESNSKYSGDIVSSSDKYSLQSNPNLTWTKEDEKLAEDSVKDVI